MEMEREILQIIVTTIIVIGAIIGSGIIIFAQVDKKREKEKQTKNFQHYFLIDPPDDYKVKNLTQGYVDNYLKSLAQVLNGACDTEEKMLKFAETKRAEIGIEKQLEEFKINQDGLKLAKINFWEAHSAAKYFGYDMRTEYTEYLVENWSKKGINPTKP